jgi:tellurite resistance protein TehA-like permease
VFALLLVLTALRGLRHAEAWAEDRRHPVRHTFIAALPIAAMLVATVAVATLGVSTPARLLWWAACLGQLYVIVWVMARWWRGNQAGGLQWAGITPALFIPVVGNVIAPLAGVPLGHAEWAAAQFGIGLVFWPVALVLLLVRIGVAGLWPERLRPRSSSWWPRPPSWACRRCSWAPRPWWAGRCGAWRCSACCGPARRRGWWRRCPSGCRTGACPSRWRPLRH